jgi:hypothetical protein
VEPKQSRDGNFVLELLLIVVATIVIVVRLLLLLLPDGWPHGDLDPSRLDKKLLINYWKTLYFRSTLRMCWSSL